MSALMSDRSAEILLIKRLQQWVPDALPWCVKSQLLQTMSPRLLWGAVLHTVIQGVSVRRQWQDEQSKTGWGSRQVSIISADSALSEISGTLFLPFPVVVG